MLLSSADECVPFTRVKRKMNRNYHSKSAISSTTVRTTCLAVSYVCLSQVTPRMSLFNIVGHVSQIMSRVTYFMPHVTNHAYIRHELSITRHTLLWHVIFYIPYVINCTLYRVACYTTSNGVVFALAVKESREPGWLEGTLNGRTGLIPANYIEYLNWHRGAGDWTTITYMTPDSEHLSEASRDISGLHLWHWQSHFVVTIPLRTSVTRILKQWSLLCLPHPWHLRHDWMRNQYEPFVTQGIFSYNEAVL